MSDRYIASGAPIEEDEDGELKRRRRATMSERDQIVIEALLAIVEEWNLQIIPNGSGEAYSFPEELSIKNFPGSPRTSARKLIRWLVEEVDKLYDAEIEVPE